MATINEARNAVLAAIEARTEACICSRTIPRNITEAAANAAAAKARDLAHRTTMATAAAVLATLTAEQMTELTAAACDRRNVAMVLGHAKQNAKV